MGSACSSGAKAPAASAKPISSPPEGLGEAKEAHSAIVSKLALNQVFPFQEDARPSPGGEGRKSRRNSVELAGRSFARSSTLLVFNHTPQEVLEELVNGNMRFILGETENPHQDFKRLQAIAPKQKPMAAILACADSRVPVELLFDQGFGDIFVCRVAGNIATAEEIASLEYAILELGVKVVMVLGHTSCGAVKAALSGKAFPGFIDMLVDHIDVAVVRAQARSAQNFQDLANTRAALHEHDHHPDQKMVELVIRENVLYQVDRCRRSTLILEAIKKGNTILVPAIYDLNTGEVNILK